MSAKSVSEPIPAAKKAHESRHIAAQIGNLPLSFELNQGQAGSRVKFLSHGLGPAIYFTPEGVRLSPLSDPLHSLSLSFLNSNCAPRIEGEDELPGKVNYLVGNDFSKWFTKIRTFATVKYIDVYPGIDVRFHGIGDQLEYDFDVAPKADPHQIRVKIGSPTRLRMDGTGDLLIEQDGLEVRQHAPRAYQRANGVRKEVAAHFVFDGQNEVSIALSEYDRKQELVIDPALDYAALIGGTPNAIAVNTSGEVFLTGVAEAGFPTTPGANQTSIADTNCNQFTPDTCGDAFVMKLNSTGTAVVYATFLGGNNTDQANGIAIDAAGEAYVTGATWSTNFPVTAGAFQKNYVGGTCLNSTPCSNAFVSVLNATGSALIYSTYLGSSGGGSASTSSVGDQGNAIAVDTAGAAFVTGVALAPNFPTTPGAFLTNFTSCCGGAPFVSKIDPTQSGVSSLLYSTFLGGSNDLDDSGFGAGIAVNLVGEAYVTGLTRSATFATPGAFQSMNSLRDTGFVARVNATGSALLFATYLGGTAGYCSDQPNAIAIDSSGNAYVTGIAGRTDFPTTPGAFQTTFSGRTAAFVSKLNATGNTLLYSTLMAGSRSPSTQCEPSDFGTGIAVDPSGKAYITGRTASPDFPTTAVSIEPVCTVTFGDYPCGAFVAQVDPTATSSNSLLFSSFLGPNPTVSASGIALDGAANVYITGSGTMQVIGGPPTTGNSFVAKIDLSAMAPAAALLPTALNFGTVAIGGNKLLPLTLTNRGNADLAITNINISGTSFSQTNNCAPVLVPAASCNIDVTFSPLSTAAGTGQVTVTDSAFDNPHFAALTGTGGTAGASLSVSSLTFGNQAAGTTSASQQVTLSSTGTASLSINSITATGDFAVTNNCGSSVAAGSSCTINVAFTPTAVGSRNGTLTVADDASNSPQTVLLGGTGSPSSLGLVVPSGSSSSASVQAGGQASYTLAIGGAGISGTASLTCTGAPMGAACIVPSTISVPLATASTFAVSVTTTSRTLSALRLIEDGPVFWGWAVPFFWIAVLFLWIAVDPRASRRAFHRPAWLILLAICVCSCGGGNSSNPNGTPAGTYTLTVTATSGATSQTVNLTLIVQ